ncbi:uncharacterized protein A1O9_08901 [Exophiala aquamarina CBS 119918]|uniref:ASST-domain-containing protein n=1 Tax=Exophiala aquamarina CBS 119918 TaxID=1182545 RepID=A0A072P6A5_9EURO|nr:uncharacterized protein A1O9_08901 [Exophiala aquamarina CBS 119918]KEF55247.1 hypothetical protein A1O9_08901 [Exophiala aquamarina CBS 119918]
MAITLHLFSCLVQFVAAATITGTADTIVCAADSRQIVSNGSNTALWPWQEYQSSDALPPVLLTTSTGEALFDGLLVIGTVYGSTVPATQEQAPLLMTDSGDLIWSGPKEPTYNARVQTYNAAPVLTYFSGQGTAGASAVVGHGYGEVIVLNNEYNVVATVCPQFHHFTLETGVTAKCHADVHESFITPRNTMLITAYNTTQADLTSVGGSKYGWILDSFAAEINISTGEVLFEWHPIAHLPINGSHYPLSGQGQNQSTPYDFFHMNSIELVGENYLINSRHFWSTYLVSPQGKILWHINGLDGGDFGQLPQGALFSWEHHARVIESSSSHAIISWFGNNNALPNQPGAKITTGVTLGLALPPDPSKPPVLLTNLTDPQLRTNTWSQGSFLHLPNGNMFIGYGSEPVMIEYGPVKDGATEGHARWTGMFGYGDLVSSYRAYKQIWHATPSTQPSLVVQEIVQNTFLHCTANATHLGYVSWNGATDVTDWVIYTGQTNGSLTAVGRAKKAGFETQFVVPDGAAFLQVGAIENNSRDIVRKSKVVAVGS